MKCPDCNSGMPEGARSCRCGWRASSSLFASAPRRFCATVGCEQTALSWSKLCGNCTDRERAERAEASCRAKGLLTVEDRVRYCRDLLKRGVFGRPSFERWAENLTQPTIDLIVLHGNEDDLRLLARLRDRCVIDAQNRLTPAADREGLRAERAARIEEERARVEAHLKAQGVVRREGIDTEAQA